MSINIRIDKLISNNNLFLIVFRDNPRFGKNNWHNEWDGVSKPYIFGEELDEGQKKKLIRNQ